LPRFRSTGRGAVTFTDPIGANVELAVDRLWWIGAGHLRYVDSSTR
jgi:hypothetical protein